MKELDETKAYDLRGLNGEQKLELLRWLHKKEPKCRWTYFFDSTNYIYFRNEWLETDNLLGSEDYYNEIINALTLFEPQLKIGNTFEKDGFICRVESEVMKWYKSKTAYVKTEPMEAKGWEEITDQDFINQLEKYIK